MNNEGGAPAIVFMQNRSEIMRISSNGNVGIGTPVPQARLDVQGDIRSAGNVYSNGVLLGTGLPGPPGERGLQGVPGQKGDKGDPGPSVKTSAVCGQAFWPAPPPVCGCSIRTIVRRDAPEGNTCTVTSETGTCSVIVASRASGACCVCGL
jgi:hypothetical protein